MEFNPAQKKAIAHVNGPMLIIAGAGTGKTQVITSRILHLINNKKIAPENILALTFTEKASAEMLERITRELKLGDREPMIKTFHAFCDYILRERGLEIGLAADYKLLSETNQWMLMKRNIFKLNLNYYRPLGNPQKFISTLLSHFGRLKDEDITPEQYKTYAEGIKGEEHEKTLEIAVCYAEYEQLLIKENCMDFGGLITWTLRLLEKRSTVLKEFQDKFKYIMVDEFQDTNFAQNRLLYILAEKGNITAVGDDDQAIYKWRGASIVNIANFEENFHKAKHIILSKNYRNSQRILDAAYHVIKANNSNKKLKSAIKSQSVLQVRHFNHFSEEADAVGAEIERLISLNRPDCAILVRANSHAKPFIDELKRRRIPYQYMAADSIFTAPVVKDIVSLLKFLADPQDDISLFRILSLAVWNFPMDFLLSLNRQAKRRHINLYKTFIESSQQNEQNLFNQFKNLDLLKKLLGNLIMISRDHPVSYLISTFLDSPYGKTVSTEEGFTQGDPLQRLADFSQRVREFELANKSERVQEFTDYLQIQENAGSARGVPEDIDRTVPKILTIHASKGLEFDAVFLPSLVKDRFPAISRSEGIEVPEALIQERIPTGDHHMEEERRLFYVAMTRAARELYLSYSDYYEGKKAWKPSPFVLQVEEFLKKKPLLLRAQRSNPAPRRRPEHKRGISDITKNREHKSLAEYKINLSTLSYSQLNTFKECPLKYRFKYLLNLPSLPSSALNFGISMHNTLRDFYETLKNRTRADNITASSLEYEQYLGTLRQSFEKNWIQYGYESREHEEKRRKSGWDALEKFFERDFIARAHKQNLKLILPHAIEQQFTLQIDRASFTGRIDRIDKLPDGTFEIIDYKTGSSGKGSGIHRDLQLSIYALAARDIFKLPVSKLTLWFLEENLQVSTVRTDKQLNEVKEKLEKSIKELRESNFHATPGGLCSWCDFRGICDYATLNIRR